MKIATYNVNSIKSRVGLVTEWLKRRQIDIDVLCLQEIKTVNEAFPYREFEQLGYRSFVSGQKTYNGVAICTKIEPDGVVTEFGISELDEQKRLILAYIKGLNIISVYAPHGDLRGTEKYHYKLKWYEMFKRYLLESQNGKAMVLAGDFNVALTDNDVYDPVALTDTIGTMTEEREAVIEILKLGFVDTFRHIHKEQRQFTWWDYTGGAIWKNEGMRIDYVFCSRSLLSKLKDVEIDLWPRRRRTPTPSDHTPVVAEFVI